MATVEARVPREKELARTGVTHLTEVAETIRDNALESSRAGLGPMQSGLELEDLFERAAFVGRFKYGLAKGVALSVTANDQRVQAIYLFDSETDPDLEAGCDLPLDAAVHLLAVVSAPSAALDSFIASLDRALVESLRELPAQLFSVCEWILEMKLITEEDIANGTGFACLLNSIHTPALRIWEREFDLP